ncbi:testis-expressed protein 52 [Ambystoma mexicanum]|uniref:testis-expressed protein 52 n=1 Tax=Ambystoma mexicanum TaxID=8296 RepID=UPI0037E9B877
MAVSCGSRAPVDERDFLYEDREPAQTGFSPRAIHRLALVRPPNTNAKIEVHRRLRGPLNSGDFHPFSEYQSWVDISRLPPLFPLRPDKPYDSNLWRRLTSGNLSDESVSRTSHKSACGSPIKSIPPPSRMTENTFLKFLSSRVLFLDEKRREQVISRTEKELKESERLILRSECRDPPRDSTGNILPPKDFKRYPVRRASKKQAMESTTSSDDSLLKASLSQHGWKPRRLTLEENSLMCKQLMTRYHEFISPRSETLHCNSRMTTERNM